MNATMVEVTRIELADDMAVTVHENTERDTIHVGLLDVDSGNYVDGSVVIFPATMVMRGAAVSAYINSLAKGA